MYQKKRRNGRSFGERINAFLCVLLVVVILPVFITTIQGRLEIEKLLFGSPKNNSTEMEPEILLIVAKQIGIHAPEEAIKAQSIIARTQLMAAKEKNGTKPAAFSVTDLQELWGEKFESYYQRMQKLIEETAGLTLKYDGEYIYAAYHQASSGNTRTINEYYEKSGMPYLVGVPCHEDTTAKGYLNVFFWSKEDFLTLCKTVFPEEAVSGGNDIVVLQRDSAGYALEVQVGQTTYDGERFRKKLGLPSACFELTLIEEDVRIVTMGQGHGFGLSQHMAEKLAEEGNTYQEILQYFYKDVSITE